MTAPTASREHVECSAQSSATPISVLSRLGFISRRASVSAGVQGQTLGLLEGHGPADARETGAGRCEDVERAGVEEQDRTNAGKEKRMSVRVDLGGRRRRTKKTKKQTHISGRKTGIQTKVRAT